MGGLRGATARAALVIGMLAAVSATTAIPARAAEPGGSSPAPVAAPRPDALPVPLPVLDGPTPPNRDAFYTPPDDLDGHPGDIIRSRRVTAHNDPVRLTPVLASVWQVLYRSTSARGKANAVSGTVLVPPIPWRGGSRPVVSYTVGTHGLGDQCAPSYELATGTEQELGLIYGALQRGWAVAVTDYEGLGTPGDHTYAVQRSEGRAALDMARAALRLPGAGLDEHSPVAFWGYSQGGGAAASAAEQADGYAPELHAVGVAAGGVPADLLAVAHHLDGSPYFGLLASAAVGLNAGYPDIGVYDLLNARGRALFERVRGECTGEIAARNLGRHRLSEYTTVADPLGYPRLLDRLAENDLGGHRPDMPVRLYHAGLDQLIPLSVGQRLRQDYCARGATVQFEVLPVAEHLTGAAEGAPESLAWLADRFAGRPAPSSC